MKIELSKHQFLIWLYIARGLNNKQIGRKLGLRKSTVKKYAGWLYGWLGVENRTQAAMAYVFAERCRPIDKL